MEVRIKSRSGWLYAVVKRPRGGGVPIVRRLGTKDMEEARELVRLAQLERTALAAKADVISRDVWARLLAGQKVSCYDALRRYEQHRFNVGHSDASIAFSNLALRSMVDACGLGPQPITALETEHIAAWINRPGDLAYGTREKYLKVVRAFAKYCMGAALIVRDPSIDVGIRITDMTTEQLTAQRRLPFTEDEVQRILAAIPRENFWHGAVLFGYHYGLRIGTVKTLEEGNVVAGRLRAYARKNRCLVNEPMHDDVAAWLEVWRQHRPPSSLDYLFPAQAAELTKNLVTQFHRMLDRIGIKDRSFDSFRKLTAERTWKDALEDLGGPKAKLLGELVMKHGYKRVQELLGHTPGSSVTADHYLPTKLT